MLVNQVLNKTLNDMKEITGTECSVWGMNGVCLAYTSESCVRAEAGVLAFLREMEECDRKVDKGFSYFAVCDENEPAYVMVIEGKGEQEEIYGRLLVSQIESLLLAYRKRVDKNRFFQNLLLDNMLLVDVLNQAKKFGIENEQKRVVFVIETRNETDNLVLETLRSVYTTGTKDVVTSVDESHIVYIRHVTNAEGYQELNAVAKAIVTTVNTEVMVSVRVAYGTIVSQLKDVSKSYKEAGVALDVGRVFYAGKNVLAYNELGIGRLIHQLPASLCEMFLNEVFTKNTMDQIDEETLTTVNQFFANNLNISETARHLYIHRNTLVYRLEKIQKTIGLDVRVFEDALTFKIAMMVALHMKAIEETE